MIVRGEIELWIYIIYVRARRTMMHVLLYVLLLLKLSRDLENQDRSDGIRLRFSLLRAGFYLIIRRLIYPQPDCISRLMRVLIETDAIHLFLRAITRIILTSLDVIKSMRNYDCYIIIC